MKRLLLGLLALFMAFLLFQGCGETETQVTFKTLNGVDAVMAGRMIQHYKDMLLADTVPQPESVWFSKDEIHNIVILLEREREAELKKGDSAHITDGIRVYFGTPLSEVKQIGHKNLVLLVSTKRDGVNNNPTSSSKIKHTDYYEHSADAALYKMKDSISGEIALDDCKGGAMCFKRTTCPQDTSCQFGVHHIARNLCEDWVINYSQRTTGNTLKGRRSVKSSYTISEWFDFELLKEIDGEATNEPAFDGVRIYFARHDDQVPTVPCDRNTFVIVTTKKLVLKNDTIHEDYFYCSKNLASTCEKCVPRNKAGAPPFRLSWDDGLDKGELCPENCNTGLDSLQSQ